MYNTGAGEVLSESAAKSVAHYLELWRLVIMKSDQEVSLQALVMQVLRRWASLIEQPRAV